MYRFLLLLIMLVPTLSACGGSRAARPADGEVTTLVVDNQNFTDMTIYLLNGGQRIRLGRATGKATTTMTIRRALLSFPRDVSFVADPIGGRGESSTNTIWVNPGDRLTLRIPPG